MELRMVGMLVTYRCDTACRHCYINCRPGRSGALELDLAERLLCQVKELGLGGDSIHLGGGEAFLYFDRVVAIVEIATRLDMTPVAWVETNCFWAVSERAVRDRLTELQEAGVGRIWLSTDPYHQEHVPLENVKRAHRLGVEIFGEEGVMVHNSQYFETPEAWAEVASYAAAFPPMLMGRAYQHLRQHLPRRPLAELAGEQCADEVDPAKMREVHVNPDGSLMASNCSGVIVGDARRSSLMAVVGSGDWRENEILRRLADRGPAGLLEMVPDFQPKETYAQKCELCWEVRSHLAEAYPDTLAPAECYSLS